MNKSGKDDFKSQLEQSIHQFCQQFSNRSQLVWIAYSGGLDSHVLLHLFAQISPQYPNILCKVIHINHQLQPDSYDWQLHCQSVSEQLEIPFVTKVVNAEPVGRQSPEEAAREARYNAIAELTTENDIVVTAHHANDQAETFFLQLMRGAGLAGLSAMPQIREYKGFRLCRPLLEDSRSMLLDYAHAHQLKWVEDLSNADLSIRRNYIRHEITPILTKQWPNAVNLINQSAENLANSKESFFWLLARELASIRLASDVLSLDALKHYPETVQKHLLRYWYDSLGLAVPGEDKLNIIINQIITARPDAKPELVWQGSILFRSKDCLLLTPQWSLGVSNQWCESTSIVNNAWQLSLKLPESMTLSQLVVKTDVPNTYIPLNQQQKRLKRLFKDLGVPTQCRSLHPILFYQEQLLLIPGIYKNPDFKDIHYEFDYKRYESIEEGVKAPLLSVLGIDEPHQQA